MKKTLLLGFVFFLCASWSSHAAKPKYISSVPFEVVGSYVVLSVRINDSSPLRLILDSGIRNTIITELTEGDYINLNFSDVKDLMGLGKSTDTLKAYSSNYNVLKVGKLEIKNKNVLVLKQDLFNLSRHTGKKINGLIGMDLLKDYAVEVNFSKQKIYFYDPHTQVLKDDYDSIPIHTEGFKMFVDLVATQSSDTLAKTVRMLIDTGAELNAWFGTYKKGSLQVPSKSIRGTIGQGFNGEIFGYFARLGSIRFGKYTLKSPVVSFPDSSCIADVLGSSERDGTVGGQLLKRFNYIIDFPNKRFSFHPNTNFNNSFNYNVAGIEVLQMLPNFPLTEVWKVWDNSPGAKAGVQIGDQILELDGKKSFDLDISDIKACFQNSSRRYIYMTIRRGSENVSLKLDMKPVL